MTRISKSYVFNIPSILHIFICCIDFACGPLTKAFVKTLDCCVFFIYMCSFYFVSFSFLPTFLTHLFVKMSQTPPSIFVTLSSFTVVIIFLTQDSFNFSLLSISMCSWIGSFHFFYLLLSDEHTIFQVLYYCLACKWTLIPAIFTVDLQMNMGQLAELQIHSKTWNIL